MMGISLVSILVFPISVWGGGNYKIPSWVRNNAKWWSQGILGDSDFTQGIQYLIDHKIIDIPPQTQTASGAKTIPAWVKNLAGMWTTGKVSDGDFLKGVEYLIRIGVIHVEIIPSNNTPYTNTTQPKSTPSISSTTVPTPPTATIPSIPSPSASVSSTNVTKSAQNMTSTSSPTTIQTTNTQTNQANAETLVGDGVNLNIKNSIASGTLTFAGIHYNAPSLLMTEKGNQIDLVGNVQASNSFSLMVVGVSKDGTQYDFYGVISNNVQSTPVKFTALFTKPVANQPASVTSNQPTLQTPLVPMLVLYSQYDKVTMGYLYNLAVKAFDPKANPDKAFDQFYGVIPDVNINGTILDESNHIFSSFSGKTDSKGLYQYQVLAPYYQGWQQIYKVILNVTKNGYTPQSFTFSFVTIYPNQGGAAACTASIPPSPTGLTATVPTPPPTQVNLSWTASSGASNYNILRGTTSSGPYTQIGTTSSVSFSDTGVTHNTTYFYVVQATNCAGTSDNSAPAFATP